MSKARLIYLLVALSLLAYVLATIIPRTHGMSDGGGFM